VTGRVVSVHLSGTHSFSKGVVERVVLLQGLGVEGDAHCGATVKHRSRVRQDPTQPNLRQVHLIHAELFDELAVGGFRAAPGQLGENITTRGLDLLALPTGTELRFGAAVVRLTGLRNPCSQLDAFQPGLMSALIETRPDGTLVRKAGVMGVVAAGGLVMSGDAIEVSLPAPPHVVLERV
jgi:MOSC domain-containing protein YiiM